MKNFFKQWWPLIIVFILCESSIFMPKYQIHFIISSVIVTLIYGCLEFKKEIKVMDERIQNKLNQ